MLKPASSLVPPFAARLAPLAARILLVLLLGLFLSAALVRLAPGYGVNEEELDFRLSRDSIQALRRADPAQAGLFSFSRSYLLRLLHGDLGVSATLHEPVRRLLAERLPETLRSVALALVLAWTAALGLASVLALWRQTAFSLAANLLASLLLCLPAAVLALLFVLARAPARLALALVVFPKVFCYARNLLARSASLPHILTARARGVGQLRIFFWHVLPVAAPQLLAFAGVSVSLALAAAVPVEALCDLPGIGQLAWQAALGRDLVLLVDLTLIVALVTVFANACAELASPRAASSPNAEIQP